MNVTRTNTIKLPLPLKHTEMENHYLLKDEWYFAFWGHAYIVHPAYIFLRFGGGEAKQLSNGIPQRFVSYGQFSVNSRIFLTS